MSIDTRDLTGARASSAVRCIAKAEHEALGTTPTNETPAFLERAFRRGVNVGRAWASGLTGNIEREAEIPWGLGWTGHADALDHDTQTVYEAYHAAGGTFREEKALQAAFYADELGPEWRAELAVIDTTDVHDDDGFAVQPYEINVDGLRTKVREIKARVVAAVQEGTWNPDDRVGDSPHHSECRSCPFQQVCWAEWRPTPPDEVPGLEDTFEALRITTDDLKHAEAKVKEVTQRVRDLRDAVRPYTQAGVPVVSGGTIVRRTEVAGRVSVKLTDFRKAGFELPAEMQPFVNEGAPSERWKVDPA